MEGETKSSPINLVNHSYFNLAGHDKGEDISNHHIQIEAEGFTPMDQDSVPTKKVQNFDKDGPLSMDLRNLSLFND